VAIVIHKKIGETPLEAINRLRNSGLSEISADTRLSYAGRLDPMAEGLLLVLVGHECDQNNRQQYLSLDKEYIVEVIFGFESDTFDLLGLPKSEFDVTDLDFSKISQILDVDSVKGKVEGAFGAFIGKNHGLKYPPYSSKTINGKLLFKISRDSANDGTDISDIELPETTGEIYGIEILSIRNIEISEILKTVTDRVSLVNGDFRQEGILSAWNTLLSKLAENSRNYNNGEGLKFPIIKLAVKCQSGVYMRSLADSIGKKIGLSALAFSINRTKIGDYGVEEVVI
jgi:tRNA U55 pseudouridine synthase TruB